MTADKPKKKRRALKSVTPAELMVACDHLEEYAPPLTEDWLTYRGRGSPTACYFHSYVKPELLSVLRLRLPHRVYDLPVWSYEYNGPVRSRVLLFPLRTVKHVLKFVGVTAPSHYYSTVTHTVE